MRAPGWGRLTAGCLLGVLALGGAGAPVPDRFVPDRAAPTAPATAAPVRPSSDASRVVLLVSAVDRDGVRVGLPGVVDGRAAPSAASVVPPGLAGPPGSTGPLGVPDRVLAAYRFAEGELARTRPGCAVPWWLLAGIGKVESGHAGGGRVDADGRTRGEVLGPLLDGSLAGTMVVRDTDRGVLDGDTAFDRAVGPMQFLPGTWEWVGSDADRDGTADPHDVDDAATTAGAYLCRGGGDMGDQAQLRAAVLRYNGSEAYVDAVLAWGTSYRDRAVAVPGQDGTITPPVAPVPPSEPVPTSPPEPLPTPAPSSTPTPAPTSPAPSSPAPSSTPPPPPSPTEAPTSGPTTEPDPGPTEQPVAPEPTGEPVP